MISKKQQKDINTILYFIPDDLKEIKITDEDIKDFLDYSDLGKKKREGKVYGKDEMNGYDALIEGKRWRGIHMQIYEDGILDGSMPYSVILEDVSQDVKEFMSKEIFKGVDRELIINYN